MESLVLFAAFVALGQFRSPTHRLFIPLLPPNLASSHFPMASSHSWERWKLCSSPCGLCMDEDNLSWRESAQTGAAVSSLSLSPLSQSLPVLFTHSQLPFLKQTCLELHSCLCFCQFPGNVSEMLLELLLGIIMDEADDYMCNPIEWT